MPASRRSTSQLPKTDAFSLVSCLYWTIKVEKHVLLDLYLNMKSHKSQFMILPDLGYELDDLDKNVEGRIPGHHTAGAFGEKCWHDTEQSTKKEEEQ